MRVLITNHSLAYRTGSELYVLELARHLRERDREVALYASILGSLADEARAEGFEIVTDLETTNFAPDILHCQHRLESLSAVLRFPDVPAAVLCHGFLPWQEVPVRYPSITAYAAVDAHTQRVVAAHIERRPEEVELILNGVDLSLYLPRDPLPTKPRTALLFTNTARPRGYSEAIGAACAEHGIELDIAGLGTAVSKRPWELLPRYDLVFAKGRAAIEALAAGTAVILCDEAGLGPMVRYGDLERLRPLNFGRTTFAAPVTAAGVEQEIARYDALDAGLAAEWVRERADARSTFDAVVRLHDRARQRFTERTPATGEERARAAARELVALGPLLREREQLIDEVRHARHEEGAIRADLAPALARVVRLEAELDMLQSLRSVVER